MGYRVFIPAIIFIWLFGVEICARSCDGFTVSVAVRDEAYEIINDEAEVSVIRVTADAGREDFAKSDQPEDGFHRFEFKLPPTGERFRDDFIIKISAESFQTVEHRVNFPNCRERTFEAVLQPEGTDQKSVVTELIAMIGKVVDADGREVAAAVITAATEDGRTYEAETDEYGAYLMNIDGGIYVIKVETDAELYKFGPIRVASANYLGVFNMRLDSAYRIGKN
jgi:hypothetical protein